MSPSKKESKASFTSLRIIGKKAQRIIEGARKNDGSAKSSQPRLPKRGDCEEVIMHISGKSVLKAAFMILAVFTGAWLVIQVRDKLIILFLAMFIAAVIDPGVEMLERVGIPRGLAVLIQYFVALFLLLFLVVSLVPIIATQLQEIALLLSVKVNTFLANPEISLPLLSESVNQQLTVMVQTTLQDLSIDKFTDALQQLGQNLSSAAQQSVSFAVGVAGSVANFFITMIVVLVLAFFMQLEKENVVRWFLSFFPHKYRLYVTGKSEAVHSKIAQWARGQLILCFSIFLLTLIALLILRMPYALTLAVLAGFCEFIPAVGPFIAAVPAILIGLTQGGFIWGLILVGMYYVIQWCENNLLVPLIMRRAVGLSPIAILFSMLIGISFPDTIHPILGVMLAIPTTTIISIFLEDWRMHEMEK
jgi:predicted PurR-regulated permease PerM